jgi:hypothetical protein
MGFVRRTTGIDLTGGGARQAAQRSAREQEAATREGLEALEAQVAPFAQFGMGVLPQTLEAAEITPATSEQIMSDPFFTAMAEQQDKDLLQQRAALGLAGSGGTQDALTRNRMLLGNQFRQQDLQNQQARFNRLFGIAQMGANAAAGLGQAQQQALTGIGQIRSAPHLAAAQVASQQGAALRQLAGAAGGAFLGGTGMLGSDIGGLQGAMIGGGIGGGNLMGGLSAAGQYGMLSQLGAGSTVN